MNFDRIPTQKTIGKQKPVQQTPQPQYQKQNSDLITVEKRPRSND